MRHSKTSTTWKITGLTALTALAAAAPASALLPDAASVREGKNITVFHNRDMVGVYGYAAGTQLRVDVLRGPNRIASLSQTAGVTDALPDAWPTGPGTFGPRTGITINDGHTVAPADPVRCWPHHTPDITPGDRIVVTDGDAKDEIFVDAIHMNRPVLAQDGTVSLTGSARTYLGDPIGELNMTGEFVAPHPSDALGEPRPLSPAGAEWDGNWKLDYTPSNASNPDSYEGITVSAIDPDRPRATVRQSLQAPQAHLIGLGHAADWPAPPQTQMVDWVDGNVSFDVCGGVPASKNTVSATDLAGTTITPESLPKAAGPDDVVLTVSGAASAEVDHVHASLVGAGNKKVQGTPVEIGSVMTGGAKYWSASFTRAQLDALPDGNVAATADFHTAAETVAKGGNVQLKLTKTLPPLPQPQAPVQQQQEPAPQQQPAQQQPAPAPVVQAAVRSAPLVSASLASEPLLVRSRVALSRARKQGVRTAVRVPKGTKVLQLALYRADGVHGRTLVATRTERVKKGGVVRVRLNGKDVRRALRLGRYILEATPGTSVKKLGGTLSFEILLER